MRREIQNRPRGFQFGPVGPDLVLLAPGPQAFYFGPDLALLDPLAPRTAPKVALKIT